MKVLEEGSRRCFELVLSRWERTASVEAAVVCEGGGVVRLGLRREDRGVADSAVQHVLQSERIACPPVV